MMHKYHNPENPGWTPRVLSSEQWESAYKDLQRKYTEAMMKVQELKLALDKANEFRKDFDVGC